MQHSAARARDAATRRQMALIVDFRTTSMPWSQEESGTVASSRQTSAEMVTIDEA